MPFLGRFLTIAVFALISNALSAQITSTFSTNAEGWTTPNDADGTITYSATGGNPGGLVSGSPFSFVGGSGTVYFVFYFVAPTTYNGNRSAYYNGSLRYDIQPSSTGAPNQYAEVIIANSLGITLYYFPTAPNQPPAAPAWTTFSVTLNNTLGFWKTTNSSTGSAASEAQLQGVLADLASLQIRGLYRDANTTNRLDNVSFRPPIVITAQPSSSTVCDGVTATLSTIATGNPALTYQWQLESSPAVWTNLTNTGGYSGTTTAALSVNTAGNFGAGSYRCRISGTAVDDVITSTAVISITPSPSAPTTTGSTLCSSASFTLTAAGGAAGQYRWYTVPTGGAAIAGQTNSTYATPVLTITTTFYVAINDGTCESTRTAVVATIDTPTAPTTTGSAACGTSSVTLTAAGGTPGQYRWYTAPTGGTAIAGQTNNTYATPPLAATTTFHVAINNGTCESSRTAVIATINTPPTAPTTTGAAACTTSSVTLTAAGGTSGQYRWYAVSTGGTAIAGQTNSNYTTPPLATTTTFYAAINNGTCESTRTAIVATINTAPATTGASACGTASVTLTAAGGAAGQYRWYTVPTGGTALAGQTNSTYTIPSLATTTTFYAAVNNGTCETARTAAVATINTIPTAPTATGASACGPAVVTLVAAGGAPGQYRWYTVATGGTAMAGQTSSTYATPSLTTTTTFYVATDNGTCESIRTAAIATINTLPTAPTTAGSSTCLPGSVTLSAFGGLAGQYRWYSTPTGGTSLAGQTNATYTTPVLSATTTYFVAINNGICESTRTAVIATVAAPGCDNEPPVIQSVPVTTQIGGIVTLNLTTLISDSDKNVDFSTLTIVTQPSSGASATIDSKFNLILNYKGISFSGIETIVIRVCDTFVCTDQSFSIEVVGKIEIFNGVSPNKDGRNDIFLIKHIEKLDATRVNRVTVYNRWGDLVWEGINYNNTSVAFEGKSKNDTDLPSGTYFYKIEFVSGRETLTGYLTLKRN
jgi:gliding motility-associated-like protein